MLEDGMSLVNNRSTEIMVGVQEVLTIERQFKSLMVGILNAEIEQRLSLHVIILFLVIGLVQFATCIGYMAIKLELMIVSLKEFVGSMKVKGQMGNICHRMLYTIIIVVLTTDIMTIVEVEVARESLICVSGGSLNTSISQVTVINCLV